MFNSLKSTTVLFVLTLCIGLMYGRNAIAQGEWMPSNNSINQHGWAPIHWAAMKGDMIILKTEIEATHSINTKTIAYGFFKENPWDSTDYWCDGDCAGEYYQEGTTAIHIALCSRLSNINTLKTLIRYKANPNLQDIDGNAPLHKCIENAEDICTTYYERFYYLLGIGAKTNIRNINGETPLHICCKNGTLKYAQALIKYGTDINALTKENETPLHYVCRGEFYEMGGVRGFKNDIGLLLLKLGAKINVKNTKGKTPLDIAHEFNNTEMVRQIVNYNK